MNNQPAWTVILQASAVSPARTGFPVPGGWEDTQYKMIFISPGCLSSRCGNDGLDPCIRDVRKFVDRERGRY